MQGSRLPPFLSLLTPNNTKTSPRSPEDAGYGMRTDTQLVQNPQCDSERGEGRLCASAACGAANQCVALLLLLPGIA